MVYFLSLGSNLGEREQTLRQAMQLIEQQIGPILRCSSFYYSEPWGFDSPNTFCNLCCAVETTIPPLEVLHTTQAIECALGRTHKSTANAQKHRLRHTGFLYSTLRGSYHRYRSDTCLRRAWTGSHVSNRRSGYPGKYTFTRSSPPFMAATRLCNGPLSGNNEDLNSTITGPSPENLTFRTLYEALNYIFLKKLHENLHNSKKSSTFAPAFVKTKHTWWS